MDEPRYGVSRVGAGLKRAITEAHVLLDTLLSAHLEALGLTNGEADVLTVILVADHSPVPSEIAAWLRLTGAGATGRLNTLERRGLINRVPNPADGRSVLIELTDDGARLAERVLEVKDAVVERSVVGRLGNPEAKALTASLDRLSDEIRDELGEADSP